MDSENSKRMATLVIATRPPYDILDFDQHLSKMTGYSREELLSALRTLGRLLYVADSREVLNSISDQLSVSNTVNVKSRIATKDGRVRSVLITGQAFQIETISVLRCVFNDITHLENAAIESAQAKSDLDRFASTVPCGLSKHLLDNNLTLLWANDYYYQIYGFTSETAYRHALGRNSLSFIHSEDLALVIDALADLTEDSPAKSISYRIRGADGRMHWVNTTLAHAGEKIKNFSVINLVTTDITNLKIAEMKAQLEEQKYLIISDISEELAYEYDFKNDILTFAEKYRSTFDGETIVADPANSLIASGLVSAETQDAWRELFFLAASDTKRFSTEFKLLVRDRGYEWYMTTFSTIYDNENSPVSVVGLLRNINTQKAEQENLRSRAERDLMTGLYNKSTAESKISEALKSIDGNTHGVFMLLDTDDFKRINDTYGHLKGDEVINNIARVLKECAGEYDIPGRLGGDEFCLYLGNVLDIQIVSEKANFIAKRLKEIYPPGQGAQCTMSIGITVTDAPISYEAALEQADRAVYKAKAIGKDCYVFYTPDMERSVYVNTRE